MDSEIAGRHGNAIIVAVSFDMTKARAEWPRLFIVLNYKHST